MVSHNPLNNSRWRHVSTRFSLSQPSSLLPRTCGAVAEFSTTKAVITGLGQRFHPGGPFTSFSVFDRCTTAADCIVVGTAPPSQLLNSNALDWDYGATVGSTNAPLASRQVDPLSLGIISSTANNGYFTYPSAFLSSPPLSDLRNFRTLDFLLAVAANNAAGAAILAQNLYLNLRSATGQLRISPTTAPASPTTAYRSYSFPLAACRGNGFHRDKNRRFPPRSRYLDSSRVRRGLSGIQCVLVDGAVRALIG